VSGSRPKRMRTGRLREESTSSPGSRKRRVLVARVRRIRAVHIYVQRMDDGASSEHQISSLPPGPPSRRARRHKGGGAIEQHREWPVPRPTRNASRPRRKKGILIRGSAPAMTSLSVGDPANAPLPRNAPQSSASKRTRGVTRRMGLGLVQSHSDGNESHFVSLSVGLETSQWDSEEVERTADAQPNDRMIDGLINLSAVSFY
jgi:hypothetical protein